MINVAQAVKSKLDEEDGISQNIADYWIQILCLEFIAVAMDYLVCLQTPK